MHKRRRDDMAVARSVLASRLRGYSQHNCQYNNELRQAVTDAEAFSHPCPVFASYRPSHPA
jgi:uncharacterized FlgJ-related protein